MQGEVINRGQEQRLNKKHTNRCVFYLIWWQITHKNFIFAGPDTGRTLLVRPVHTSVKQKIPQKWGIFYLIWWPWSDSNRHSLQNLILSQARLPIPPRGQKAAQQIILLRLYGQQPFSPGAHCDWPCALVFWLVFQLCPIFY